MIANLFEKTIETTQFAKPLLKHFQENGLDWMHACGGKGRCTTCKVIIRAGQENVGPLTPAEKRYAREGALKSGERLACQVRITGDVCIAVPREYQLPHVRYSDGL